MKRFWLGLGYKAEHDHFPHQIFFKSKYRQNIEKIRKMIYVNNYQCLIINKDNQLNQQSQYDKILSWTLYITEHDLLP